jgi:GTP-binding protein Era
MADGVNEEPFQPGPDFRAGFVAIVGVPNVGKSTLMNAILKQKISIVTPKPQTTRHKVLGIHSDDHCQIVFLDTPGIIAPKYALHTAMMDFADSALHDADIVLMLVDASEPQAGTEPPEQVFAKLRNARGPVYLVLNKCDAVSPSSFPGLRERWMALFPFSKLFIISALKNDGVTALVETLASSLPVHPPYYPLDILSEHSQRFFVTEIIREKIFLNTHEEVPYSTTVDIVTFTERETGKWFISADVVVERDSQKGILIGKGGSMLKKIGQSARRDIERFLDCPIFLELHVKVREKWREDPEWLKRFGYKG